MSKLRHTQDIKFITLQRQDFKTRLNSQMVSYAVYTMTKIDRKPQLTKSEATQLRQYSIKNGMRKTTPKIYIMMHNI